MDDTREGVRVGVDELPRSHIIEGDLTVVYVHKDANPLRLAGHIKCCGRIRAKGIVMFVAQAEKPVAMCRADRDLPLAVDGLAGYAQVPIGLRPHVNLPVVSARRKPLLGQDTDDPVKAPRRVWHWLVAVTAMNPLVVRRENEPWVSSGRVKGHIF